METKLNDKICNFKIGACYKNTKYDPNSDTLRSVKYFTYLGENTFLPIGYDEYEMSVKLEYDDWKNFVEVTKDEAFRNVYNVNMNDNEVWEIAEMQKKIDSYEGFILAIFRMMKSNKSCCFPLFTGTDLEDEMNFIWKTTKGLCDE